MALEFQLGGRLPSLSFRIGGPVALLELHGLVLYFRLVRSIGCRIPGNDLHCLCNFLDVTNGLTLEEAQALIPSIAVRFLAA